MASESPNEGCHLLPEPCLGDRPARCVWASSPPQRRQPRAPPRGRASPSSQTGGTSCVPAQRSLSSQQHWGASSLGGPLTAPPRAPEEPYFRTSFQAGPKGASRRGGLSLSLATREPSWGHQPLPHGPTAQLKGGAEATATPAAVPRLPPQPSSQLCRVTGTRRWCDLLPTRPALTGHPTPWCG